MFAGRTDVLTKLIGAIEGQRLHSVIYGERGMGKTSLLHVLGQAAQSARYLVVYISCGAGSNFDETIRSVAEDIPLLFHNDYGPTAADSERGASFADLLPSEPVSVRLASDLFSNIVGTRVIVLMDEFDRSESEEFQRNIAELIKNLSDRAVRMQFVITGVAANLTDFVSHIPGIRRNIFALQVPAMTATEIRDLVKNGEEQSDITFEPAAIEFIIAIAHGMPYIATLISHHAGLAAVDSNRLTVTTDDVSAAIAEALSELNGRLLRTSQLQIAEGVRKGVHKLLSPLSREAIVTGGKFTLESISTLFKDAETATRCRQLITSLAQDSVLVEAVDDQLGLHYRFLEESTPIYFWLLEVQERYLSGQGAAELQSARAPVAKS
jgi:Cdc6-like AAA superfamily ATPase